MGSAMEFSFGWPPLLAIGPIWLATPPPNEGMPAPRTVQASPLRTGRGFRRELSLAGRGLPAPPSTDHRCAARLRRFCWVEAAREGADIERRALMRGWVAKLTLEPLDPVRDAKLYQPLRAVESALEPVFSEVELAVDRTAQLVTGPRGSGKSTELLRLKKRFEEIGYQVAYIDLLAYVNRSTSVDIIEILIALALGVADVSDRAEAPSGESTQWRARFQDWFNRLVDSTSASLQIGPARAGFDLASLLRESPDFLTRLRQQLAFHIPRLHAEVDEFIRSVADDRVVPGGPGFVVIVDSLEKLRGTTSNNADVQASVERLFVHHGALLRFDAFHAIYTVPVHLKFTNPGALGLFNGSVRMVPILKVHDQNGADLEETIAELVELVGRRIKSELLLGDPELLRKIILASGGHIRDLLRIVREVINLAFGRRSSLPAEPSIVDQAIAQIARDLSQLSAEDADFLRLVARSRGTLKPSEEQIPRLARLLDQHLLLVHSNTDSGFALLAR